MGTRRLFSSSFLELAKSRRSTATFTAGHEVPAATLRSILEVTLRTPTSFNLQPYCVVLAQTEEAKVALSDTMLGGNRARVLNSSLTAVFVSASLRGTREGGGHAMSR